MTNPTAHSFTPLLGAHMSTAGGAARAINRALSVGCTALQIFVKNNMQWAAPAPLSEEESGAFLRHPRRGDLGAVCGHAGYLINLAATNPDFHARSIASLRDELRRADQLELPFLVLHPGAHMGAGEEAGLRKISASLDEVFAELPADLRTKVALETTAGQGTCLGHRFEHLAEIFSLVRCADRLTVCVDTAHLFAAGYDISDEEKTGAVFAQFQCHLGRDRLAVLHVNDSKTPLGSRVDRHAGIGLGQIGTGAFRYVMQAPELGAVPKILETPKGKELTEDAENMARLRELAGVVGERSALGPQISAEKNQRRNLRKSAKSAENLSQKRSS